MRTKFNGILTLLFALIVQISFAQEKTVSGTVSDEAGPLPGVSVLKKGTASGTETDFDGNFSIKAKVGDVLVFSFVGMKTQERVVGNSNTINVELVADNVLDEVVVVAYGSKKREELTSAVTVVAAEELSKLSPTVSADNMLQGNVSGALVTGGNGKPGQTSQVLLRGIGSINSSQEPLFLVDGVVVQNTDVNNINPLDIESISVLKDAATASLYGSRAANGVVVITTKRGSKNKAATITVSSRFGVGQMIEDNFKMMNAAQKIQYERELAALGVAGAAGQPGAQITTQEGYERLIGRNTDWKKTLLKESNIQSNSLSIRGGSEETSYFFSLAHDKNSGIINTLDGYERMGSRLNLDFDANKWLKLGVNVSVTNTRSREPRDRNNVQNPFRAMYDYNPYETLYQVDDNNELILDEFGQPQYNLTASGFSISEALINNPETEEFTTTTGGLNAVMSLSENLTNTVRLGAINRTYRREYFIKPGSVLDGYVGDAEAPGIKTDNGSTLFDYTVTNILAYNNNFADKHDLTLSGLFEYNERNSRTYTMSSRGYSNPDISVQDVASTPETVGTNLFTRTLYSLGGFMDYSYDGKYLATASVRRDGSSTFGADNQFGTFWSASAAWNISKEDFMANSAFDNLKLRVSYGTSGNREGIGSYPSIGTVDFGSLNGSSTSAITDSGNSQLSWETNKIFDVGVEFSLFNSRLRGVVDYFSRTTSDLLFDRPLSSSTGEQDQSIFANIGEINNNGIEVELSGDIIRNQNFKLSAGVNVTFLNNEVTKLVPNEAFPDGAPIIANNGINRLEVGNEIWTWYLVRYAGVNSANGEPLYYDADGNVTNVYSADNAVMLDGKSPYADLYGGFNINAEYKDFSLTTNFAYKFGHYIMNYMEGNMLDNTSLNSNMRLDAFNYWKQPGDTNVLPSPLFANEAAQTSDRFLQKGDYVRLRNVTLSYKLPSRYLQNNFVKSLRLFVSGDNLWTYAPHFNGNPEIGIGSGETTNEVNGAYNLYSYPQTQSISVGVDLKF